MNSKLAPYGSWQSALRLEEVFARPSTPMYPFRQRGNIYWLESIAAEGGRMVLMRAEQGGTATRLTPDGFNIRSRVHEYGGKCFCVTAEWLLFSNYGDGRLYRQRLDGGDSPQPLTPTEGIGGLPTSYADLHPTADGRWLICVAEIAGEGEHRNLLVTLDLKISTSDPQILIAGSDFYASPVLSSDDRRMAWLEWSHPNMPWDESRLWIGDIEPRSGGGLEVRKAVTIAGGPGCSVCQPMFAADGSLLYAMDSDRAGGPELGFWNLYRWRNEVCEALTADEKEYGEPFWVFGENRYTLVGDNTLIGVRTAPEGGELIEVDLRHRTTRILKDGFASCAQFSSEIGANEGKALFIASHADREAELMELDTKNGKIVALHGGKRLLASEDTSLPQAIRYPTRDHCESHAWYYPPVNSRFQPLPDSLPPLVVMVHGGPTSRSDNAFTPLKQFFTGNGFAVLDVNHRGSSGYGRRYRQVLLGNWGETDADDVADAIDYVVTAGWVDGESVFVRGSSAGGYAVLRTLTRFPEQFCGGACYYGIGNLITLARSTHKFEVRYIDGLIGESFDPERAESADSRYRQRSPIFFMDRIRSPLILFQGLEDKVVPPELSREVVETLKRNDVMYDYVEYPNEGHGFRSAATRIDSLRREIAFYGKVMVMK